MAEVAAIPENAEQFHFETSRVAGIEQQIEALAKIVQMPGNSSFPAIPPAERPFRWHAR